MQKYSNELKEQVIQEVMETGNISVVAQKHNWSTTTVHGWVTGRKNKDKIRQGKELRRLERELAEANLEIRILKELLKKTNQAWLKDEK